MSKNLSYGSSGEEVKELQTLLNKKNNAQLEVDGVYGSQTESAVKAYQQSNGLAVDGIAGTNTIGSLKSTGTSGTITGNGWQGSIIGGSAGGTTENPTGGAAGGTASSTVQQAQQVLSQYRPNGYSSGYSKPLDQTVLEIINRKPFEYNVEADPIYQNYRDYYQRQGRLAMEDAMGKAATLTGGYGNSYAQQVGQQTYQNYLDKLNEVQLDLRKQALSEYEAGTSSLYDRYQLLAAMEGQDFDRWYTDQQWQQKYGTPLGGGSGTIGSSGGSSSGNGKTNWDNGNVSEDDVKKIQAALGVTVDGKWGPESYSAAGDVDANTAWLNYLSEFGPDGSNTGLEDATEDTVTPESTANTDYFIKRTTTNDKGTIVKVINNQLQNGQLTAEEAVYLVDYYKAWDEVPDDE